MKDTLLSENMLFLRPQGGRHHTAFVCLFSELLKKLLIALAEGWGMEFKTDPGIF